MILNQDDQEVEAKSHIEKGLEAIKNTKKANQKDKEVNRGQEVDPTAVKNPKNVNNFIILDRNNSSSEERQF